MENFSDDILKLESAARAATRWAARNFKRQAEATVSRNFSNKNKAFGKVKVVDFSGSSIVSIKPGYLEAFEKRKTISSKSSLIILLPDGERLGFKRISPHNPWASVWQQIQNRARLARTADGTCVVYEHFGRSYAIYKFQKSVTVPKLIDLTLQAELELESIRVKIDKLMDEYD